MELIMADGQTLEQEKQGDILQLASFYLSGTLCGIDINQVQEVNEDLNITQVPLSPDYVEGIMNLRGQIVTIINQGLKLGLSRTKIGPESRVVIVNSKEEQIGVLVDKVTDVITISRAEIADSPANINGIQGKFFDGIFHTENNELMALLNIEEVLTV
jgi:purine-binding chemotaxis protein CheW